jgi:hypothetical protein
MEKKLKWLFLLLISMSFINLKAQTKVIGKAIRIETYEVAQFDFPQKMTWAKAKKACSTLGVGWRLPNRDEMYFIYDNNSKIGGFEERGEYWIDTESDNENAWIQGFSTGGQFDYKKSSLCNVRAIRTFTEGSIKKKKN